MPINSLVEVYLLYQGMFVLRIESRGGLLVWITQNAFDKAASCRCRHIKPIARRQPVLPKAASFGSAKPQQAASVQLVDS